jgi:hypothetical protein
MRNFTLLFILSIFIHSSLFSQGCFPEGITFTTQEQIDDFQNNYPSCTEIEGDVTISGDDIANLNGLNIISVISGNFYVGDMDSYNPLLFDLSGIDNLTFVGGDLIISNNTSLSSLTGLEGLTSTGGKLTVLGNFSLEDLSGLENLNVIGAHLHIAYNTSLENFNGLNNLESLGGELAIGFNFTLDEITNLETLHTINGHIWIEGNQYLESIAGIHNINAATIEDLYIFSNESLSYCNVESVCNYIANPNGLMDFSNNAEGCTGVEEVEAACTNSSCLPEGITFTTQEQINNFQLDYPGCTSIEGDLFIFGNEIFSLSGLNVIANVHGTLNITGNDSLNDFSGLENMTYIGESLFVDDIDRISDLNGLNNLAFIGSGLLIDNNDSLLNLEGLENLSFIDGPLYISSTAYSSYGNPMLISFSGLNNLDSINGIFRVCKSSVLEDFTGLENLSEINGEVHIHENEGLISLSGLDSIKANSIYGLQIYDNPLLSDCAIESICEYITYPSGMVLIKENASGCNWYDEVEDACPLDVPNHLSPSNINIYPNPVQNYLFISGQAMNEIKEIIIYNSIGELVLQIEGATQYMDVSNLQKGIYLVEVNVDKTKIRTKLIIN